MRCLRTKHRIKGSLVMWKGRKKDPCRKYLAIKPLTWKPSLLQGCASDRNEFMSDPWLQQSMLAHRSMTSPGIGIEKTVPREQYVSIIQSIGYWFLLCIDATWYVSKLTVNESRQERSYINRKAWIWHVSSKPGLCWNSDTKLTVRIVYGWEFAKRRKVNWAARLETRPKIQVHA